MSKRILVIEDTEDNRQIIRDLLTSFDYELIEAVDGAEGVAMAETHRPDLILMDIQLPVMDGYEATRRIREAELRRGTHTTIVALTADALAGDRERCIESGMDDYMTKPVSSAMLAACVERWTGRKTAAPSQW